MTDIIDLEDHRRVLPETILDRIREADTATLTGDLGEIIRNSALMFEDRERICKAYRERYFELEDVKLPIGQVRERLAGAEVIPQAALRRPEWARPWVWVNTHGQFFNTETYAFVKTTTFDIQFTQFVPERYGRRPKASAFVTEQGFVDVVARPIYMPTVSDTLFDVDGESVVNIFNRNSLPKPGDEYTSEGEDYLDFVEAHLGMLCGGEAEGKILLQWLAHQVQNPGVKLRWAPLIRSIEGVGKSFVAEILRICLGVNNVGVVKPSEVTSAFNAWAANHIVNVLEELKIAGHNRYEALNALKPLVTDDFIQINGKGVDQYKTQNFANYIAFTNYRDALPLDNSDRRWWVVECPLERLDDIGGGDKETYFETLWNGLRKHPDQVRAWLHDVEVSAAFLALKQAPMTEAKKQMITTEEAMVSGLLEVKDTIEEGGEWVCEACFSSAHLFAKLRSRHPDLHINTTQRNMVLKRLGYILNDDRIKIDGKKYQYWSKRAMTLAEFRACCSEGASDAEGA